MRIIAPFRNKITYELGVRPKGIYPSYVARKYVCGALDRVCAQRLVFPVVSKTTAYLTDMISQPCTE